MKIKVKLFLTLSLAFLMQFSFAQEKTITGIVSDSKGTIPGVNVNVKGTKKGVQTDFNGVYSIKASEGNVLTFSFIGMKEESRVVGSSNSINVTMLGGEVLETVVVTTAFGIKKRKDALVSSTQVVGNKELTQASSPNVLQSLSGKVSGLQINQTSNGVQGTTKVVLRGPRSISGNNEALVVIDGAISSLQILNQLPNEIVENLTVLKGQQGGILYGEQGSNGVIIVTTKKGAKTGKLTVSLNSSTDFQSIAFVPEVQTRYGQGWYGYDFKSSQNAGDPRNVSTHFSPYENGSWGESFVSGPFAGTTVPIGLPQPDGSFITGKYEARGKDNFKDFYKTGLTLQNGFTLNAGSDDGYALLSFNRQTVDFVVDKDILKRNNILFKAGKKIGNFNIDGSINYTNTTTSTTDASLLEQLIQTPNNVDINKFRNAQHYSHWTSFARNPFRLIDQIRNDDRNNFFIGNIDLGYKFNKYLTLNFNGNVRTNSSYSTSHDDGYKFSTYQYNIVGAFAGLDGDWGDNGTYGDYSGGGDSTSSYNVSQSDRRDLYSHLIANFNFDLTENWNLKANIGGVIQDNLFNITTAGGTKLDVPGFYQISNVLLPTLPSLLDNRVTQRRQVGAFANLDFGYKDFLFFNLGARNEKSSTVIKPSFYKSFGASFVVTKGINALKDSKIVNYFKINASYAEVGNRTPVGFAEINDLAEVATGFPFGSIVGYEANPEPTIPTVDGEKIKTAEFGINLGMFSDRLTLDASVYRTTTENLITNSVAPRSSGLSAIKGNIGDLENNGFEIDLGITPVKNAGNGFNWTIRTSYSVYKTVIKSLAKGVTSIPLQISNANGYGIYAEVGEEFPLIKGTSFQRNDAGQIIVDANGNALKNVDFRKLGKSNPDYIIGLTNTFNYRGFQLSTVADFRTGHSFYSVTYRNLLFTGGALETAEQDRFAGYIVPNSVQLVNGNYIANTTPAYSNPGWAYGLNGQVNEYFNSVVRRTAEANIIDATALKIREIALSYSLPSRFIKSTGLESFRIGINARNPFTFFFQNGHGLTNKGYSDPEASNDTGNGTGVSNIGQYPTLRTLGFSVNLTF